MILWSSVIGQQLSRNNKTIKRVIRDLSYRCLHTSTVFQSEHLDSCITTVRYVLFEATHGSFGIEEGESLAAAQTLEDPPIAELTEQELGPTDTHFSRSLKGGTYLQRQWHIVLSYFESILGYLGV